eukprot:TRINITY_DN3950_c0_g1_i1.p2 TRINITY_DN3950_c0_g1~~TRINITY_DN3950_c0_g1_i1.p2  ORF type:complete len:300 (+),score=57.53 TRINITY_DN3950_c0_g1_i1:98-901(+)
MPAHCTCGADAADFALALAAASSARVLPQPHRARQSRATADAAASCACGRKFASARMLTRHRQQVGRNCDSTDADLRRLQRLGVVRAADGATAPQGAQCVLSGLALRALHPGAGLPLWRAVRRPPAVGPGATGGTVCAAADAILSGSALRPTIGWRTVRVAGRKRCRADSGCNDMGPLTRDAIHKSLGARCTAAVLGLSLSPSPSPGGSAAAAALDSAAAFADLPLPHGTLRVSDAKRFRCSGGLCGGDGRCCAALSGDGPPCFEVR